MCFCFLFVEREVNKRWGSHSDSLLWAVISGYGTPGNMVIFLTPYWQADSEMEEHSWHLVHRLSVFRLFVQQSTSGKGGFTAAISSNSGWLEPKYVIKIFSFTKSLFHLCMLWSIFPMLIIPFLSALTLQWGVGTKKHSPLGHLLCKQEQLDVLQEPW